jgi:hypothetical protein
VSLLGRKKDTAAAAPDGKEATPETAAVRTSKTTAPKGRPTPKRDTRKRRGPIAPAPMTTAEARRRRKELRGPKLSREERKVAKAERRHRLAERRERMMAGDEDFLLPRDRGPIRRYVRDIVDARRNPLGLFMPAALGLIFIMLAVPQVYSLMSPAMLLLVAVMIIDGFVLGRKVNRLVDEKFGDHTESRWRLGFYAASRASQLRRMRAPRARVNRGDAVA